MCVGYGDSEQRRVSSPSETAVRAAADEYVVEGRGEPDRERAREHRGLAECRDLDPRWEREPFPEQPADRVEQ